MLQIDPDPITVLSLMPSTGLEIPQSLAATNPRRRNRVMLRDHIDWSISPWEGKVTADIVVHRSLLVHETHHRLPFVRCKVSKP